MASGPLHDIKIIEFAGIGPGPFAGMALSDMGASVLRIERKGTADPAAERFDARGRTALELDLKQPRSVELCLELCESAEMVFEGFRPGVMERLGLGPEAMLARNPRLVYGRITGWGQTGPYRSSAGHDINYLALSGALHAIGTEDKPVPPLNLAADYGGGSTLLLTGMLAALIHARATGQGQVVDAAIVDGAAYLMTLFYGFHAAGRWQDRRRANLLDGGAPFYDTYRCADGKWIAVGALEPQFYSLLLQKIGLSGRLTEPQMERNGWPHTREALQKLFATRTRRQWCELLEATDACFAPVLSLTEAPRHPHNEARETFVDVAGIRQPAPAPRFSATPSRIQWAPAPVARDVGQALRDWGVSDELIAKLGS